MAKLIIRGLDEMQKKLSQLSTDVEVTLKDKMLDEGAKVGIQAWKDNIRLFTHIETSDMINSVGVTPETRKGAVREIYPLGKDRKGVRNAEKAFYLHYGTVYREGDLFVDDIEDDMNEKARVVMRKVLDDYLAEHGLL